MKSEGINSKVSVPPHKGGLATGLTPNPVKTGGVGQVGAGSIKGFGTGGTAPTLRNNRGTAEGSMRAVKGFSGSGVKSGKA